MYVCGCVCVCVVMFEAVVPRRQFPSRSVLWSGRGPFPSIPVWHVLVTLCNCVFACLRARTRVCLCVCERACVRVCLCVCVSVCMHVCVVGVCLVCLKVEHLCILNALDWGRIGYRLKEWVYTFRY